jgi:predicted nucleotidyltransferase
MRELACNSDISDEIGGFHAQQAALRPTRPSSCDRAALQSGKRPTEPNPIRLSPVETGYSGARLAHHWRTRRSVCGRACRACHPTSPFSGGRRGYDPFTMAALADDSLIAEAGRRLAAAAPGARVILFGSYARGEARPGSDLDLLVVEPRLSSRRQEFGRLRMALGDIGVPVDLIVVSDDHVSKWGEVPGGVIHEALRDGRVLAA